jgi:hypothetical protein
MPITRKLLFIIVLFFSTSVFAEVFYCYEEGSIGFDKDQNKTQSGFNNEVICARAIRGAK